MKSRLITALAAGAAIALVPSAAARPAPGAANSGAAPRPARKAGPAGAAAGLSQGPAGRHRRLRRRSRGDAILGDAASTSGSTRSRSRWPTSSASRRRTATTCATLESGHRPAEDDEDQRIAAHRAADGRGRGAAARVRAEPAPAAAPTASRAASRRRRAHRRGGPAVSQRAAAAGPRAGRPIPARTPTPQGFHQWEAGQYDQAIARSKPSSPLIRSTGGSATPTTSSAGRC